MEVTQLQKDPVGNKPTAVTFPQEPGDMKI